MTSLAWEQRLLLGLLLGTRKEPWAGLLLEPEFAGAKRPRGRGGSGSEVTRARSERAPVPAPGEPAVPSGARQRSRHS